MAIKDQAFIHNGSNLTILDVKNNLNKTILIARGNCRDSRAGKYFKYRVGEGEFLVTNGIRVVKRGYWCDLTDLMVAYNKL